MAIKRSFTVAFIYFTTVFISEVIPSNKILGGIDVPIVKYPWVASIRVNGIHSCSGSIINKYFILTAARCVSDLEISEVTARVGTANQFAGGKIFNIHSVFIHPSFGNFLHDIALLKTDKAITFNDKINQIPLAGKDDVVEDDLQLFTAGWGLQENGSPSYKLKHLSLSVLSEKECERLSGYGYKSVICLNHLEKTGICHGDEGAGIVSGTKIVAVASFYFGNCGTKYPDVASSISYYGNWINDVVEKN